MVTSVFMGCGIEKYSLNEGFARLMKVESRATNIKLLDNEEVIKSVTEDDEYDVIIITDVHIGNENKGKNGPRREDDFFAQIEEVNSETGKSLADTTKFALCLGDVAEHGYEDEFIRFNELVKDRFENDYNIKLYSVVGNHDLYNSGWYHWAYYNYPNTSFYKFETPSFSWYFLDSASGTLGGYQYDELRSKMINDDKQKLVFTHIPVYAEDNLYFVMQNTEERNLLISTCARTNTVLFVDGHTHKDRTSNFGYFIERNVPGFLEKYGYAVLHVNEKTKDCSIKVVYY